MLLQCKLQIAPCVWGNGWSPQQEQWSGTDPLHNKGHGNLWHQPGDRPLRDTAGANGSAEVPRLLCARTADTKVQGLFGSGSLLGSTQLDLKLVMCDCAMTEVLQRNQASEALLWETYGWVKETLTDSVRMVCVASLAQHPFTHWVTHRGFTPSSESLGWWGCDYHSAC